MSLSTPSTQPATPPPPVTDNVPLWRRLLRPRNIALTILGLFVLIQLVPVWIWQANPPTVKEPAWDSQQTRDLAVRACFDCHSNQTTWPLYSKIAPVSWLVTRHVVEGREHLNFSDWGAFSSAERGERGERGEGRGGGEAGEAGEESAEMIREGEMPPRSYLLMHPEAKLTPAEQQLLADGLLRSLR